MKGFINKRDKIKWEDTPFQPELTGEKLAELVSEKLSLDDLKDVKYFTDPPADGRLLMYQDYEHAWVPSTVYLNNLEDVSITSPQTGQILVYDRTGYAWKNTELPLPWNWSLAETRTADGTTSSETFTLDPMTGSAILDIEFKAGASALNSSIYFTLDDDTVIQGAFISNAVGTSAPLFSKFLAISLGNLLVSLQGSPTTAATNAIQGRYNTMLTLKASVATKIKSISVSTQDGNIPLNSVIKLYTA